MPDNDPPYKVPPNVYITDARPPEADVRAQKAEAPSYRPPPPKKTLWRRLTATLRGRNKLGQALGVIKDVALSFTPLGDRIGKATGHVTNALEASGMGRRAEACNLSRRQILLLRIVALIMLGLALWAGLINPGLLETLLPIITN